MTEYELYHYGVKGMKWGHRKQLRLENRVSKRYARVGRKLGEAEYERSRGAEEYKKHETSAKAFDKAAKQYEKNGNFLRAEASRKAADAIRQRGENIKRQRDEAAAYLEKRAAKMQEKASSFATKKRVDLGQKKINSILGESKKKGFNDARELEDFQRENELRERMGDDNYETYNYVRGRS
jgi:hypothetical protein